MRNCWNQAIDAKGDGSRANNHEARVPMRWLGADRSVVCAEQRVDREGSSPSGARMRSAVSKSGGNASLAGEEWKVWRSLNGHEGESRKQPRRT